MRNWNEAEWREWREEREAIVQFEGKFEGPVSSYVAALVAIEQLRAKVDRLYPAEVEHKQMELPI